MVAELPERGVETMPNQVDLRRGRKLDKEWVELILLAQRMGMSVEDVRKILKKKEEL
ncbi:hypothetical protein GCM10011391_21990 [Pullulanibacillus camelliae]|uniref:Sin domain-containing protein n=1 Tax=Pullulanibacillus camelliae TaxID=1707096 RepID=A0A8J2YHF7_9BACL|nr:anti-repressor SinI family protein [Pullulanibacillus camelliae]GGE42767.1 hypothetical protein GCM10011391_21990 [Pullulanibacillus camelliae]